MYQFDNFAPFALGGLGFYRPSVTRMVNNQIVESDRKTTFGWHLGLGADLKLNLNYSAGILAHYHHPFDVQQDLGPKVSGSYCKLMMTFMYSF
jgi:opacity protein-like surface antigen